MVDPSPARASTAPFAAPTHRSGEPPHEPPSEPPASPYGAGDLPDEVFRTIVDHTAHPFVVIARDGTIRYAGHSIEHVIGWPAHQVVGCNVVDFLPPDQVGPALEALAEIDDLDRGGAGVPMVFELLRPDGTTSWVELGAMPLLDVPGVDGIVLRHRPWDEQRHFDGFVTSLLADDPLDVVLTSLCRSVAASVQAVGATLHHGFDGRAFAAVDGVGVPAACRRHGGRPWLHVAATGEASHLGLDDLPAALADSARAAGFGACWLLPVVLDHELGTGVLTIWRPAPGAPLLGHRRVLERAVRHARLALVRADEQRRLRHLARHDALTGAANRREFHERLDRALAEREPGVAVAFCDLDDFKAVNDTHGHAVGDAVLVEAARRLRSCLRPGDELARIGGDEFTVLLRHVADAPAASLVAERLRHAFDTPLAAGAVRVTVGLSVGVALAVPGASADALVTLADAALYERKRRLRPR